MLSWIINPSWKGFKVSNTGRGSQTILLNISQDQELKQKYDLMLSVKGVGKVLAAMLLVYTHGFNRLTDSRKLACYSGVAPFVYESGTSHPGQDRRLQVRQ